MTETVNTYWAKFGIDASEFVGGINQAQTSFLAFYRDVTLSATMTLELIGKITETIKAMAREIDSLQDLAIQTGLTTREVQELQYVAISTGTEFSTLASGLNIFTRAIGDASVATSAQAEAFKALSISVEGKSTKQLFDETITQLGTIENVSRRNVIANDLFGRSYKELIPLVDDYKEAAAEASKQTIISDETMNRVKDAGVRIDTLSKNISNHATIIVGTALREDVLASMGALMGDPSSILKLLAMKGSTGTPTETPLAKKAEEALQLTNTYQGLTDAEIDMRDAQDGLNQAMTDMGLAKTQKEYDAASRSVQMYTNRIASLNQAQIDAAASAAKAGGAVKTAWGNDVIVGTPGSEMYDYLMSEMESGTDYQTALQKWSQGQQHMQAGSLGAAKDSGAASNSKVNKITDENKKIQDAYAAGYVALEKLTLTHETAEAEMARIKYQSILDVAGQTKNWLGSNPLIQKQAVLSKNGYDIDISPLPNVTVPRLASADFGSIKLTGGAEGNSGGGNTTNTTNNVYVTTKDNPNAVAKGVSQALANQKALGGAT